MRSESYQIDRFTLATVATREYLKQFWWYVAIIPTFGLLCLIFGYGPIQVIGVTALMWPLTIPGRAALTTGKTGRLFAQGTYVTWDDRALYFHATDGGGMKLEWAVIRKVVINGNFLVFRTRRLGFIPIPLASITDSQRENLLARVQ